MIWHDRRLIDAAAAPAAGTRTNLDERIKQAACNALSIVNHCDSAEDLERELDKVTAEQNTKQKAFQTEQNQNNKKFA